MKEIFFLVEEDIESGYTAKAIGESIFTEAEALPELRLNIEEALECHFDNFADRLKIVHLYA